MVCTDNDDALFDGAVGVAQWGCWGNCPVTYDFVGTFDKNRGETGSVE